MGFSKNYQKFFMTMVAIITLGGITTLISPILINQWMNQGIVIDKAHILVMVGVMIVSIGIEVGIIALRERFAKEFNKKNFILYIEKYFNLQYDYIIEQGPTNLVERIQIAVNSLYRYYTGNFIKIFTSGIIAIAILIIVARESPLLSILMLMLLPINYMGYRILNKELQIKSITLQEVSSSGWQRMLSILGNTDFIKQLGDHTSIKSKLEPVIDGLYQAQTDVNIYAQSASGVLRGINNFVQTLLMVLLVYRMENTGGLM